MAKISNNDILRNDVLCGLLGKACHCKKHAHPFEHFNIKEGEDSEIILTINGIEVHGAAGFLQAYYRQYEKLIANRVRTVIEDEFSEVRGLLAGLNLKIKTHLNKLFGEKEDE